jgi:hypothetical protein
MRRLLLLALCFTLCVHARAHDWQRDVRLQKPVTLRLPNVLLDEAAQHLSNQTEVTFTIDPSLKGEKATLFITQKPAWQVLDKMVSLLGLKCQPQGEGYVLLPDPILRQQEQAAAEWEYRATRREAEKNLRTWAQLVRADFPVYATRALDIENEMTKLEKEKPAGWQDRRASLAEQFQQVLQVARWHRYLAGWLYRQFPSSVWRRLWNGETIWFSTLPTQGTLPLPVDALRWKAYPAGTVPRSMRFGICLDENRQELVFLAATWSDDNAAEPEMEVYTHPVSPDAEDKPPLQMRWEKWSTSPEEFGRFQQKIQSPQLLPAPPAEQATAADSLLWIAQQTGMNIIADAFRVPVRPVYEGNTLAEWLSRFTTEEPGYVRIEGGWLLFRHARYWLLRRSELPETLVRQMEQKSATEGLTLDDYAALASRLTPAGVLRAETGMGYSFRFDPAPLQYAAPALRFWASLTDAQKQLALQRKTVPYTELAPAQRKLFREAVLAKLREQPQLILLDALNTPEAQAEMAFVIDRWREATYTLEGERVSIAAESAEELEQQRHLIPDAPAQQRQMEAQQMVLYFGLDAQRSVRYNLSIRSVSSPKE